MNNNNKYFSEGGRCFEWVYSKFITRGGRKIYRKNGGVFRFPVEVPCSSCEDCK